MSVDYRPEAIEARLQQAAGLTDLTTGRRLRAKVDYSPAAIEARLLQVERALQACRELGMLTAPTR